MITLVLAGNQRQFEDYCRAHNLSSLKGEARYIGDERSLYGWSGPVKLVRYGSWYDNSARYAFEEFEEEMYREFPELRVQRVPAAEERVETGAVQFGEDWPGTFVRGDDSYHLRLLLEQAVVELEKSPVKTSALLLRMLKGFAKVFNECNLNPQSRDRMSKFFNGDRLLAQMQTPEWRAGAKRAFNATPKELGEAALKAAKKKINAKP